MVVVVVVVVVAVISGDGGWVHTYRGKVLIAGGRLD